jgi:hypothetical protein
MTRKKHWLINKKGIDWWHILIAIGILAGVFLIPFKEKTLTVYDVNWYFIDRQGNIIDPTQVEAYGGFGVTTQPQRLEIANIVGTNMLIHPPYGPASVHETGNAYAIVLELPKSKITLIHQSSCAESMENDGVRVTIEDAEFDLYMQGKEIITDKIIVSPKAKPDCDWVWISGFKQISLGEWLYYNYIKPRQVIVPAGPFAVIEIGE